MTKVLASLCLLVLAVVVSGCTPAPVSVNQRDVDELAREIQNLGPDVDPAEAKRAASIAFTYSAQLAQEYEITDPPIVHNAKVNNGWRERGLCWHWAEDIEKRLNQENFRTLELHRAISDPENPFLIDHSTAIISAQGQAFDEGVVLDPWRGGGALFWSPTLEDPRYDWAPRLDVLRAKQRRLEEQRRKVKAG